MHIGIDFDNTLICYDPVFHRLVCERYPELGGLPPDKRQIRDHLRTKGREDEWTRMQGEVYGRRIAEAEPFPGVVDFLAFCRKKRIAVSIISHKTRTPFLGPPYDLHRAAMDWMTAHGFFDAGTGGLTAEQVFLELTKKEKMVRIAAVGCTHFIDDLPEFLTEPQFPDRVQRILFDPGNAAVPAPGLRRMASWTAIRRYFRRQTAADPIDETFSAKGR